VSSKAFEQRSLVIRQDRARLSRHGAPGPSEPAIETAKAGVPVSMLGTAHCAEMEQGALRAFGRPQERHFTAFRSAAEEIAAAANRRSR
jgi:hypothetical protein